VRQLPYDALEVTYVNATKDEPRLMMTSANLQKRRERSKKSKKIQKKPKKTGEKLV
jgi:hypothetical protein